MTWVSRELRLPEIWKWGAKDLQNIKYFVSHMIFWTNEISLDKIIIACTTDDEKVAHKLKLGGGGGAWF